MQTTGDAARDQAAANAIEGRERRFRLSVRVDWNNNGRFDHPLSDLSDYVGKVTTDRSLKGSAPAELLLVEGSSAAELTLAMAGEHDGLSLVSVFSPYNGFSPLFRKITVGAEIVYRLGVDTVLGTVWYDQFVGNIRTISPDRATGEVEVSALDRMEKLRSPVNLATYAVSESWTNRGRTTNQLLNATSVIQTCLQQCDTSASKYRMTTPADLGVAWLNNLFISGMGGFSPARGWHDNPQSGPMLPDDVPRYSRRALPHPAAPSADRRYQCFAAMEGRADADGALTKYWIADKFNVVSTGSFNLAFTLNLKGSTWHRTAPRSVLLAFNIDDRQQVRIEVEKNQIFTVWRNEAVAGKVIDTISQRFTLPDKDSCDVHAHWDADDKMIRYYLRVGDQDTGGWVFGTNRGSPRVYDLLKGLVYLTPHIAMSDVSVTFRTSRYDRPQDGAVGCRTPAKYAAELDDSANSLSYLPKVSGRDAADVIKDVAASEFASVFWDERGVFRFWNFAHVLGLRDTRVRTLTTDDITGLKIMNNLDSVRNTVTTQANRRRAQSATNVYESNSVDEFYLPVGGQRLFEIRKEGVQFTEPRTLARHTQYPPGTEAGDTFPQWNDASHHGYVCAVWVNDHWEEPTFARWADGSLYEVEIYTYLDSRGVLMMWMINWFDQPVRLSTAKGKPNEPTRNDEGGAALRIDGTLVKEDATIAVAKTAAASMVKYGPRNLELSGDWHQEFFPANDIVDRLLTKTVDPIPATDEITIPGDPRLQLGDAFDVRDPAGLGERFGMQILGIRREFSRDNGLTDTLTVEMIRPPESAGIWDSAQFGRWDETFVWS